MDGWMDGQVDSYGRYIDTWLLLFFLLAFIVPSFIDSFMCLVDDVCVYLIYLFTYHLLTIHGSGFVYATY